VAFLDSDDEWTKDYLSTQMEQIEKFPAAVAHITNAVTILKGGRRSSLFLETGLLDSFRRNPSLIFDRPLCNIGPCRGFFSQHLCAEILY
jgi:hypothetical protein